MQKKGKNIVKDICFNGLFAAVYVAFVLIFGDLSFGFANGIISFRVAELLIALCCFNKRFIPGAIIGCLVANIYGGQMIEHDHELTEIKILRRSIRKFTKRNRMHFTLKLVSNYFMKLAENNPVLLTKPFKTVAEISSFL